jgi:hypothetical protein
MAMADIASVRSVAGMSSTSITPRRAGAVLAGMAVIYAVVFSPLGDEWFFVIVVFGPLLHGAAVALRRADVRLAAITWAACGLFWLVLDYAINQEDVLFHLVLSFVMAGLVHAGAALARLTRRPGVGAPAH